MMTIFQTKTGSLQGFKPVMNSTSTACKQIKKANTTASKVAKIAYIPIAFVADLLKYVGKLTVGNGYTLLKNAKIKYSNSKTLTRKVSNSIRSHKRAIFIGTSIVAISAIATTGIIFRTDVIRTSSDFLAKIW